MTTSSSLAAFCAWAAARGIVTSLVPKESKGMGVGLFVSSDHVCEPHDQESEPKDLLFIPADLLLSRSKVLRLDCPPLLKTFDLLELENVTERLALVLFLLYGRLTVSHESTTASTAPTSAKTNESSGPETTKFWPYIASLPEVSTPVTLEPELAKGYLAGTLLLDSVCAKRRRLESEFEQLSGNLGVFEHWPCKPTLMDFIWADATFWSRVLSFESQLQEDEPEHNLSDDMHMAPFLDFANHADTPNIRWQVASDGLHVFDNGLLEQNTDDKPITQQEAFLSYGNKPNMELLLGLTLFANHRFLYGFILPENPTRFLTLAMPMDEEDPFYMPKAHTLMRLGIPPRITLYLNESDATDLVKLCEGLWITKESQMLLWIYAINEEDGLGALIEDPEIQACAPHEMSDEATEEMTLEDEDTIGRLVLTISDTKIVTQEDIEVIVPTMEIFPLLILRGLVFVADQVENYVARIMETGDKVQRVEDVEIVRAFNYESDIHRGDSPSSNKSSQIQASSRLGGVKDCHMPTLLQDGQDEEVTDEQLKVEAQVSSLVSLMKAYRTDEMAILVDISNFLGEGQTKCLEESDFIRDYLEQRQVEQAAEIVEQVEEAEQTEQAERE
ncbi:hypothetical protein BGZ83_006311 [Gryganskiella cystojenkinii]|nr:hypothetical protein BGZ83_006311 [Gryganskiella cystojenkinii]